MTEKSDGDKGMRLQVFLSRQGVCSRRKAMDLIQAGRVSVNGRVVTEPSTPVLAGIDRVTAEGKEVAAREYLYLMINKPAGCVTTREDRFADQTVLDLLPEHLRHVNPVGRLDKDTEGLLFLTNDGDLAFHLTHPRFAVEKTYTVRITKGLTPEDVVRLEQGVVVDGRRTAPARCGPLRKSGRGWSFELTVHEGRKRQVRLMLAALHKHVSYLQRIRQGPLQLGDLPLGKWRVLSPSEVAALKKAGGLAPERKGPTGPLIPRRQTGEIF